MRFVVDVGSDLKTTSDDAMVLNFRADPSTSSENGVTSHLSAVSRGARADTYDMFRCAGRNFVRTSKVVGRSIVPGYKTEFARGSADHATPTSLMALTFVFTMLPTSLCMRSVLG